MKTVPKYADELKSLFKRLRKGEKPPPLEALDPLRALVRGAMSYDVEDERADQAMALIEQEFVDLNELRVATDLEVQELLGARYPEIEKRVALITQTLNYIFEHEHTMSLERLRTLNKREARQFLKEIPDIHPFVEAFIMLHALEGNCIPLDQKMLDYLAQSGAVDPALSLEEAQRFVEHHIKAEDAYEFYRLVRTAAAGGAEATAKKKGKK
jgi:hypothetical protein